ncbi:MAG: Gfo/Idh/MocA family oxidoreductase, partial [Armatimonadetes bacterium]|nr:Gfo/Idh/MocA family oxidoreductase [Armatimonadota bacterium]
MPTTDIKHGKVGIGIIGCGGIGFNQHIPAYLAHTDLCDVVAVCDISEELAKKAGAQYDVKHVYTDYVDLLARDDIQAVSICTPNLYHFDPTIAALTAGKHVLVEKPLADTVAHGEMMVEVARKAGRKLMCCQNRRFDGATQALKKFVDEGRLGTPYWARAQALRRRGIPGWGVFIDKAKQGGGPLIDIGVHVLDTTLYLMGQPKPVAVSGATYVKFGNRPDVLGLMGQWDHTRFTVEDFATAMIRFEDGATIMLESSFAANLPHDVYDATILGDKGGLTLTPPRLYTESMMQLLEITPTSVPQVKAHQAAIGGYLKAIIDDTEVPVPGHEALNCLRILDAVYRSAEAGCEMSL